MEARLFFILAVAVTIATSSAVPSSYTATPVGYVLKHCQHKVSNGAHLHRLEDGRMLVTNSKGEVEAVLPLCNNVVGNETLPTVLSRRAYENVERVHNGGVPLPADYDGWEGYTAFYDSEGFDAFLGRFSVPSKPQNPPDIVYLFTGLQNINWIPKVDPEPSTPFDIIQPVLQYPGDYGYYWSVKSWYVTLDIGTVESSEIQVESGDYIFGNMTRTGATSWFVGSTVGSTGKITQVTVDHPRLASQPWAYNTLECYGCQDCSTYPSNSPCAFTKLQLLRDGKVVTPKWVVNPKPSSDMKCHELPCVQDPSDVTIYFNRTSC